jgi:phage antirepressor YoqD-like protein
MKGSTMHALSTAGRPAATTIAGVDIRQDADGRYSLNDLHRASGGEKRHRPNYWLANDQTKALVLELVGSDAGIPVSVTRGGPGQGTYVCRELVYAYAMWISPSFHLKVIRAYDTLVQAEALTLPKSFAEALRLAAAQQDQIEAQQQQIATMKPQVAALVSLTTETGALCQRDAAKHLGVAPRTFTGWLLSMGWTYRQQVADPSRLGRIVAYQDKLDRGYLAHRLVPITHSNEAVSHDALVQVTRKGLARLACYIQSGKGPK